MSYSKVKVHGYPELGDYQLAYHIVRESDLLTAYNIPRSIVYNCKPQGIVPSRYSSRYPICIPVQRYETYTISP